MTERITTEEIKTIVALARLEVSDTEVVGLKKDLSAILDFVSMLQAAPVPPDQTLASAAGLNKNQLREDSEPHPPGIYTEKLLAAAPAVKNNYLKVKPVFDNHGGR